MREINHNSQFEMLSLLELAAEACRIIKMHQLKEDIRNLALKAGFSECGFTSVAQFEDYEGALRKSASADIDAAARYTSMLARARPAERLKWAKSIVVCVRRYGKYKLPEELVGHIGRNYLCDSRNKSCPDNEIDHKFVEGLRELGVRYKRGGLPDRAAAARAGVVRMGRNNFAYSRHGSWINIETWVLDADIEPDEPTNDCPCPEGCSACIDACPTKALHAPYEMRMSRCIAYLSYSAPQPIEKELWDLMGGWVYGCDVCQQVCPMNQGKWEEAEDMPWIDEFTERLTPNALMRMDYDTYRNIVHPRFWYIKLDDLERWHLNAARAVDFMDAGKEKGQP